MFNNIVNHITLPVTNCLAQYQGMEKLAASTPPALNFVKVDGVPRVTSLSGLHDGLLVSAVLHPFTYREVITFM